MKALFILTAAVLGSGSLFADVISVDPANYTSGTDLTNIVPQFTLTTADKNNNIKPSFLVDADTPTISPLPNLGVFGHGGIDFWNNASRLRIDFKVSVTAISIEFIGTASGGDAIGTLDVYDSSGDVLSQFTTPALGDDVPAIMTVSGLTPGTAAYAIATGNDGSFSRLTDLAVTVPEPSVLVLTLFGAAAFLGFYRFQIRKAGI